jgi:hypothetical protein
MTFFTEFFTNLRENLDRAHHDRKQFCLDTKEQVNELAQQIRGQLAEFASDLKTGGQAFRKSH